MARKRVKRNHGEKVQNEPTIMAEDRISQLPDSLIHYIFSFLPTIHLVRMSGVSRRWRRMWVSTPFLYFDCQFNDVTFTKDVNRSSMFLNFVKNCLRFRKRYMQRDTFLISFKLDYYILGRNAARQVDSWVRSAIQSKVKELDLDVEGYRIPQVVYTASSLTQLKFCALNFESTSLSTLSSLTQLELRNLKLEAPFLSKFPTLKHLSLIRVVSDYKSLENLISGCPIIEDLCLVSLKVINHHGLDLSSIDFPAKTLKNLTLSSVEFTDQGFECLISRLAVLERLTLDYFDKVKNLSIHSHCLKYLSFCHSRCTKKTTVRTPNLVYLHLKVVPCCMSTPSIEAPNLSQANLQLCFYESTSYFDFVHFLSNLRGLKKMFLSLRELDMIFPEDIRNRLSPPLPNLKHLYATVYRDHKRNSKLHDFLVWCAPSLETIEVQEKPSYCWSYV